MAGTKDEIRGRDYCRGCDSRELFSGFDLGNLPIANELLTDATQVAETYPLHLRICKLCGLGQVEDVVTPNRIFSDYRYLSSVSTSFVEHARKFVEEILKQTEFEKGDWVLEIASNDGYLLQHFLNSKINVLGVEPAKNVALVAIERGIPTISEFFGLEIANSILESKGFPKLIVANNVLAHVPDIKDFISGIAKLCGPKTLVSIENPSMVGLFENRLFDTIYHEHFSYLTSTSVRRLATKAGLELYDVESIPTHGGSNRYWLQKTDTTKYPLSDRVDVSINSEKASGIYKESNWAIFSNDCKEIITSFKEWLENAYSQGLRVYGYGAAAKASTLINATAIKPGWIKGIADGGNEKQGRFLPSQSIPIMSPTEVFSDSPTDIVIFPWNISEEITRIIRAHEISPVRIWTAIPKMSEVS